MIADEEDDVDDGLDCEGTPHVTADRWGKDGIGLAEVCAGTGDVGGKMDAGANSSWTRTALRTISS